MFYTGKIHKIMPSPPKKFNFIVFNVAEFIWAHCLGFGVKAPKGTDSFDCFRVRCLRIGVKATLDKSDNKPDLSSLIVVVEILNLYDLLIALLAKYQKARYSKKTVGIGQDPLFSP